MAAPPAPAAAAPGPAGATAPASAAPAAAAAPGIQAPHAPPPAAPVSEAARLAAEKEQKERALQEKLDKRATIVVAVLRKFITAFYAGRQQMLDEARAAELAKKARTGKKKGRKKKGEAKDDKAKKDAKGGKGKPKRTPVQEAWFSFLGDMDERISKQKRVNLEDVYRGVFKLEAREVRALQALLATTTNKILPLDGLNITQMNIRESVTAASAAACLPAERAVPASGSSPGLSLMRSRGGGATQILAAGYKEADLLRYGFPAWDVVGAAQHTVGSMQQSGLAVTDLLASPAAPALSTRLQEGAQGLATLRAAGYSASECVAGGLRNAWALAKAGYSLEELQDAGLAQGELVAAGFARPEDQAQGFLAVSMRRAMQSTDARTLPPLTEGTQGPVWKAALSPSTLPSQLPFGTAAGTRKPGSPMGRARPISPGPRVQVQSAAASAKLPPVNAGHHG